MTATKSQTVSHQIARLPQSTMIGGSRVKEITERAEDFIIEDSNGTMIAKVSKDCPDWLEALKPKVISEQEMKEYSYPAEKNRIRWVVKILAFFNSSTSN